MKLSRLILPFVAASILFTAGCSSQRYYAPPPPPPPGQAVPPLIERARHEGFRAGHDDGVRDARNGYGYHPRHDRKYRDTPGYDSAMGPFGPYQNAFRNAYLRGYDDGFHQR